MSQYMHHMTTSFHMIYIYICTEEVCTAIHMSQFSEAMAGLLALDMVVSAVNICSHA